MSTKLINVFSVLGVFSVLSVLSVSSVLAADSLTIRATQPQSPTNQTSFKVVFVTLDIANRPVNVTCYKKGPTEGDFSQFGSVISLASGGNTGACEVTSAQINNSAGDYQFKVMASAGSDTASDVVVVAFDNNNPGTPYDYSKEKISSCDYRIKFKTSDRTSQVEVYRSDKIDFNADNNTKVSGINIGSNQSGEITNSVPDCNKTYYYALRAVSSAGNASDLIGDREVTTTIINPTSAPGTGAIASGTGAGTVLGQSVNDATPAVEPSPEVLGDTVSPTPEPTANSTSSRNYGLMILGLVVFGIGAIILVNRRKKV